MKTEEEEKATYSNPKFDVSRAGTKPEMEENDASSRAFGNWGEILLGVPEVWQSTMGEGVKVAVLDTGVQQDHPDLKDAIVGVKDFTGDGIADVGGHGTHCAGMIGARPPAGGDGFVGIAPRSQLLIGKVLGNGGSGSYGGIAAGIDWAVEQDADIISMSLGGSSTHPVLFEAVHSALAKGKLVICAAGNEGSLYQNSVGYPGKYGSVITVGAHDKNGNRTGFSSAGGEIDFLAPGEDILSTYIGGSYARLSGTSMATPFVAGLSALVVSKHSNGANGTPLRNNAELNEHLSRMATHPGWHDSKTGYGVLQPLAYYWG